MSTGMPVLEPVLQKQIQISNDALVSLLVVRVPSIVMGAEGQNLRMVAVSAVVVRQNVPRV